jgi:hypothetical protein
MTVFLSLCAVTFGIQISSIAVNNSLQNMTVAVKYCSVLFCHLPICDLFAAFAIYYASIYLFWGYAVA